MHLFGRPRGARERNCRAARRRRREGARGRDRRDLPAVGGAARARGHRRAANTRQAAPRPESVTAVDSDRLSRPRPSDQILGPRRARLHGPDGDPGAVDPRAARRPRRDRPGPDRHRQDRGLRAADAAVPRSRSPRRRRRSSSRRPASSASRSPRRFAPMPSTSTSRSWRCSAGSRSKTQQSRLRARSAGRRRDGRPDEGPDVARRPSSSPRRATSSSTRPTRCSISGSSRTSSRSCGCPERAPDAALLGDDAAADRAARRDLHVRPGDDQGDAAAAHGRRDRAGLRRGRPRRRPPAWSRCSGGGPRAGDHLLPHQDRHGAARQDARATGASRSKLCTATSARASATA